MQRLFIGMVEIALSKMFTQNIKIARIFYDVFGTLHLRNLIQNDKIF